MAVIETRDLRKHYGRMEALRGVTLKVEPGEVFGLLGQNGAGKTTLIKILLGIVKSAKARPTLLGHPAGTAERPQTRRLLAGRPPLSRVSLRRTACSTFTARSTAWPRTIADGRSRSCSNWSASPAACTTRSAPIPRA